MTTSAVPQNASYQALYRSCMKEAASRGHTLMQKLATRCVKSMAQRAAGMPDQHERNLLTEAARILMKHQEALCEAYPQALLAEFAQAIAGANARSSVLSFDSLELMGEEQLQESVEVVRTQQAVVQAVEAELAELNGLVCAIQGLRTVQAERNPLRPEVYVRALRTVTMQSPIPPAVRTRWMQHLGEALGPELAVVYRELSQLLRAQGVMPAGYTVSPGRDLLASTSSSGASGLKPVPPAQSVPTSTLLNVRELRRLLSGQFEHTEGSFAAKFEREFESGQRADLPPDFSPTVPAAFETLQEMKGVDRVMEDLKRRSSATAPPLAGMAALRERLRHQAASPGQALGLEVVGLMVDNIASDARLLPPVQQAVRDLEPALLRLVLEDPRFFSDKGHPARRLLEQLTQRSLAWSAVDAPGFAAFYEPLQQAVDALLSTRVAGPDPFEFALTSLEEAWGEQSKRERRHRARAVQALLQAEQRNLLAGKVSRQLRTRADVASAAKEVSLFVTGPWSQVIAQARLSDAAGGADPGGYAALLTDMLWSAQPQLAGGNPMRLARIAPRLLEKIREGLTSIDYPPAETRRFIDLLVLLQQQALAPAAAAVQAPMTPQELESWFAAPQSDDVRSPWLAPGEAQESGFMETHQGAMPLPLYQATQPGSVLQEAGTDWLDAVPALSDEALQPGAWVEMQTDGRWGRLQLTWASPHGTLYMFSDAGGKTHSMTRRLLDQLVAAQSLRLVSDHAVVDGALDAVAQAAVSNSPDLRP
ncbi:DUF1631 family protein [Caenimonas terrae]|uniref:DUF1631 family protein n=1 Tax=Caenimonas terrae TaxID=696074 RepID=A0ABW0NDJ1_9BURK